MNQEERKGDEAAVEDLAGTGPRLSERAMPRRTVLRGALTGGLSAAVALPWLESMALAGTPSGAAGSRGPAPRRLLYVYVPNGVKLDEWRGAGPEGMEFTKRGYPLPGAWPIADLPPLLKPLAPHAKSLQILRGLAQSKARPNGDGPGDHARASAVFLTGVQPLKTEGRVQLGVSADQVAAREVGGRTRVRSLVFGVERGRGSGQCDSGYACVYSNNVSWESPTTPATKEVDPKRAFDRLFRGGDAGRSVEERESLARRRRSLLDFVRAESKSLHKRLGAADRARLDEYETGVRELERQLAFDDAAHTEDVADDARPQLEERTFAEHATLLGDVIALAFRTDVTRIATLMYANEGSGRAYSEIGVSDAHHGISHHGGDPEKLRQIGKINGLHMQTFARLVDRLAETEGEGGGSLLDSTMAVYGSGIADGDRHDHHDLPMVLVAGRHTETRGGRTVAFVHETPANDLHLALLARMGAKCEALGDSRGVLDGI